MAISESFLDELRARVALSDVVGRRVTWDKRKTNLSRRDYWACCPFHNEKSPSFHVDDQKGFYHCFGCGASGDVVRFLIDHDGMGFREAVAELAQMAGLEVPDAAPEDPRQKEKKKTLHDVLEATAEWFHAALKSDAGKQARHYAMERRKLDASILTRFRVGFAPSDRQALRKALLKQGFVDAMLVEAGLCIAPEDGGEPFVRFRDRLMFPIEDARGAVVGFGGRDLSGRAQAKYLNSPETPVFHKSNLLYNFKRAREASRKAGTLLVTEGYMDVIACARAGLDHAVAPNGTALTEEQLRLMWRTVSEPVLCFDGDQAGRKAAFRAVDLALQHIAPGHSLRFVLLPDGKDPDDLLNEGGRAALEKKFSENVSFADMLFLSLKEQQPLETPEQKAAFKKAVRASLGRIGDKDVREFYAQDFEARLSALFGTAEKGLSGPGRGDRTVPHQPWEAGGLRERWVRDPRSGRSHKQKVGLSSAGVKNTLIRRLKSDGGQMAAASLREARLVALLIRFPGLIEPHLEEIADLPLSDVQLDRLMAGLLEVASEHPGLEMAGLKRHLTDQGMTEGLERLERDDLLSGRLSSFEEAERRFHGLLAQFRVSVAETEVRDAEDALRSDFTEDNSNRLSRAHHALELARAQARSFDD